MDKQFAEYSYNFIEQYKEATYTRNNTDDSQKTSWAKEARHKRMCAVFIWIYMYLYELLEQAGPNV